MTGKHHAAVQDCLAHGSGLNVFPRPFRNRGQVGILSAMARPKRPFIVSLDQVRIVREPTGVFIDYADPDVGGVHLTMGEEAKSLSDQEILDRHNECLRAIQELGDSYEHVAVEVPPGKPQLQYMAQSDQWVPRGGVVRAVISDGGPDCQATFWVDDREMSLEEFGRMFITYAGWGVRLTFVPEDEVHLRPVVEVREPQDEG